MSGETGFLQVERKNLEHTVTMLDDLLARERLSSYEVIALGTLLQNVYSGIERILRYLLQSKGIRVVKGESWHKELLIKSKEDGLLSASEFESLLELLLFRHLHTHGYSFSLDEKRLRQLAIPVPSLCWSFLKRISYMK
jgi:hypothetical protein